MYTGTAWSCPESVRTLTARRLKDVRLTNGVALVEGPLRGRTHGVPPAVLPGAPRAAVVTACLRIEELAAPCGIRTIREPGDNGPPGGSRLASPRDRH